MLSLVLALGCPEAPAPQATPSEAPPLNPLPAAPAAAADTLSEPVDVRFAFQKIANNYRYYFSEPEFTGPLEQALGACFDEYAEVVVTYNLETLVGRIFVQTPRNRLGCAPIVTEHGLDVRPLVPVTRALAAYRDALASGRDFRLANFAIGVRVVDGVQICDLWAEGQNPPDGSTFSACVTLQGHDVCDGDRRTGHQRIPWPADRGADLRGCFR